MGLMVRTTEQEEGLALYKPQFHQKPRNLSSYEPHPSAGVPSVWELLG